MIVSTPGRICLFGEHQDYLGLPVIAAAISKRIQVKGQFRADNVIHFSLPDVQKTIHYYETKLRPEGANPYSRGYVQDAFALLNKDIPYDGTTFGNPEVRLTRDVAPVMHSGSGAFEDAGSGYSVPETVRKQMEKQNGNNT